MKTEHVLCYEKSATCFNEALPLGNGRIGAMVYGSNSEEKISLNEDTFWSGYPKKQNIEDYPAVYQSAQDLFDEGRICEAQELLEKKFGDYLVQMYLPLADMHIKTGHEKVTRYHRMLTLDKAVHTVSYQVGDKFYKREMFISDPYQVMAICFQCNKKESLDLELSLQGKFACGCEKADLENTFLMYGIAPNCVAEYGTSYKSTDNQKTDDKCIRFVSAVMVRATGGMVTTYEDCICVKGADEVIVYFSVRTNFKGFGQLPKGEEYKTDCMKDVQRASCMEYERLKRDSINSHRKLYNRTKISLGKENVLYTRLFNYGKYLTIAGSRRGTQPMNLQGIWNDKVLPPWNCNYTLNINTEMNYWPTLACGLFECYEPFVQMVEELAKSGKETARNYYGVEGWVCHHSTDIWRMTHPGTNRLPNSAPWGFWNMASGWLSLMLWNYYSYTLDEVYLKRIYPVLEEAAKFYHGLLVECDGTWILPISTSPENNYIENRVKHGIDRSTAMTQEILFDLFSVVQKASVILGKQDLYGDVLPKLKRPHIQNDGELCEWHQEREVWDVHHRHLSHLYGLFPSYQFSQDKEKFEACRNVLESRGDAGTGWSLAWKINLWARLGDGERALKLLNRQLQTVSPECNGTEHGGGSYPNLLCAHPPFQIDGNFGATSGIIEMLMQYDHEDNPMLLPALPKAWKKGSVSNLYLRGNRKISFAWEDGQILWSKMTKRKS